ncbi:MAG: ABC transporter ATP-binding protein/permease [Lachnospiraceae bacterium]|nr:ABC transporter ATP-binding protein/permease [Lachnospiraceae bacterium]
MDQKTRERLEAKYTKKNEEYIKKMESDPTKGGGRGRGHGPGPGGMKPSKPKNAKKSIARLFSYMKGDGWKLIIVAFLVVISSVASVAGSYILRPVINSLTEGNATIKILANGLLNMAVIYMASIVAQYTYSRIMIGVAQNALEKLRNDLFKKISKLPLQYYDTNETGDVMSRFTNDVDAIGNMLGNTIISIVSGVISLFGTLGLMIYTNIWLTIITILMTPLMVKAAQIIATRSRKYYKQQQAALGSLNGYIEETISGQKIVQVFNHEGAAIDEFDYLNADLRNKQLKAQFFGGIMFPVLGNLSQVSYAVTATIGGIFCVLRGFDIGGLTIFVNYSKQFSRPINELSAQVTEIFSALAGAERVFDVMDTAPELPDAEDAKTPENLRGEVTLENVTFGYVEGQTILKDVSFYAKPGQKIALVGSTGAGKTTITNLITRFYDINSGSIKVDGVDIRDLKRDYLRKNIAMVLQDTHLFSGTVMENIRYGRLDATDEEVIQAAKTASAHSFIMRLENGYDTVLEGDGANLSQGQRQLLNIARAAISKAPILILDEATSSVDTRTERHIEHGMDRLMKDRTTIVIAHRLSTVRNANAIIVLEHGQIIERGNHEELLDLKGRYYELYTGKKELD